jgi:hypothetical protein
MAGTYIQGDVYGQIPDVTPLFNARADDDTLLRTIRDVPAVAAARKACDWVVVTAMYQRKPGALKPPNTTTPECWLAFVDRAEHATAGWTQVPLVLFSSYERNENAFKVMMPAVLLRPMVFLNHVLPQSRCFELSHIRRGKELAAGAPGQPHLLASKIPSWSGRSLLSNMLQITRDFSRKKNSTGDLADLDEQEARMARAGFNSSSPGIPRITDTLWMIWPKSDEAVERLSRLWLHEVARFSSFEKVSYPWVVSQVPDFRPKLTDAIYIYSPQQRCGWKTEGGGGGGGGGAKKKGAKRKTKMMRLKRSRSRRLRVDR